MGSSAGPLLTLPPARDGSTFRRTGPISQDRETIERNGNEHAISRRNFMIGSGLSSSKLPSGPFASCVGVWA